MSHASLRRYLAAMLVAAIVLNWLWEMFQMPAFVEMSGKSWSETALVCTLATVGDTLITLFAYGLGALVTRRRGWALDGGFKVYGFAAVVGTFSAVVVEWFALSIGPWSYTEQMPEVFGIGLLPLLQLTLLVPAAFYIARWWNSRSG